MDKEMKKLLLVAVSVGVFLLVTITISLIILTPKAKTQETSFSSSVPYSNARPIPDIMSNMPEQVNLNTVRETNAPVAVNTDENGRPEVVITSDRNNGDRLTIQVPRPVSAAIPETSQTVNTPVTVTRAPATQPAASATRTQTAQPAATRTQAARTSTRSTTQSTDARSSGSRTINDYWIQTGAFSAIVRAEDAKETLATNGLISIIENRIIDGKTWYRVRLGPYTSEREANHWLTIVKAIDGFGESQVRQTIRVQ